ncbi:MerR family transcriptional regulator [Fodinicola feengrottensis]|uniref:MerR family transcriptional regulator n=1 Tax=Fodinicola feengrottensis TaxID=435914 RepID=UPI0024413103|nr:MerR family transcriptional regulator [Fodinicola feengrottensis]
MELVTIGAFARMARLSAKALRLYDELGLLRPAEVDEGNGYRYYDPAQVERARLIAWLRRLDMPLARIRLVCELPAAAAASEVAAYWQRVVADTAAREQLATFLIDHLSGRDTDIGEAALAIRYAARSAVGMVRTSNEDIAFAGERLWAVADGVGGRAGGLASEAAVNALKPLENLAVPTAELLNVLADAVDRATEAVREIGAKAATTLTAALWSGTRLALVHVGDSRAYLLRAGDLFHFTHDHTYVQAMVDEGRLTAAEAESHPDRALLVQAVGGKTEPRPDFSLHSAVAGDRYLLCSDGLSRVVEESSLRAALAGPGEPARIVDELIRLAYESGAPDNIACVVADVW